MLIVAIPKSASTSLLDTLKRVHNYPGKQISLLNYPVCQNMKFLHSYHSDIRELTKNEKEIFSNPKKFYKQHIPPSENNIKLLNSIKKVVLLRDPEGIIKAYFTAEKKKIHRPRKEIKGLTNVSQWLKKANELGLYDDLVWFYKRWYEEQKKDPKNILIIQHKDLIQNTQFVINQIESFFGLKQSKNVQLSKRMFSRAKGVERFYLLYRDKFKERLYKFLKRNKNL